MLSLSQRLVVLTKEYSSRSHLSVLGRRNLERRVLLERLLGDHRQSIRVNTVLAILRGIPVEYPALLFFFPRPHPSVA